MLIRHRVPTKEVSRQTGFSPVTIWRKSKSDESFPAPIYIGSQKFFYQDEVTEWIEANERTTPAFNNLNANQGDCND